MKFLNKDKDNIISIVKSLRPINYLYSKQNKDYHKFFSSSSLKGLIKQINSKPKYNEFLKPGESLEELKKNKNNVLDINFKNTFNYLEELSNLKNLPMVLLNKKLYKRGRFNNDYEESLTSNERRKRYKENEKKKKQEKISNIKNSGDAEVTLDPGRYHPNYNFIKKRYPCAYLGKPKIKEESFEQEKNKIKEVKKNESNNNSIIDNDEYIMSNRNIKIKNRNKNNNNGNKFNRNLLINRKKNKKMNFSSPNFYSMYKSISVKNNENNKIKKINEQKINNNNNLIYKLKDHNTVSSWSQSIDLDKSKKISERIKLINTDKNKTNYNCYSTHRMAHSTKIFSKNKKKLNKNTSAENLKCNINFDKMQGRDRPINFVDGGWEGCRSNYNPDYNIIRPHIRSTIFKSKRKYQNFKKYITGKIIRSYCYSPDKYFVFEIKENKENEITGKYGTIILKS